MNSDADKAWERAIGKLRRKKGFSPLSPKEADAAYEAAPAVPLSAARISDIVKFATGAQEPVTVKSPTLVEWGRRFPMKAMKKFQFTLTEGLSDAQALLEFFDVASPAAWQSKWDAQPVAYRQTQVFDAKQEAVAAWVREAELIARKIPLAVYDERMLRASLGELRRLTREPIDEALGQAQMICSRAGVAMVMVPELPSTRLSGCARWLDDNHALVGLTSRYKKDDQIWFTFFHEIGHILLHRGLQTFVVDNAAEYLSDGVIDSGMVEYEREANRFAADTLIPPDSLAGFVRRVGKTPTSDDIHNFADAIGIGPGLVVGRLQHDGVLEWHQGNTLKQTLNWDLPPEG